jgi:2-phospho-L-lactate guanylyltransferase
MDAGLLPVKRLERAKARLGPEFGPVERTEIARALLSDALDLCVAAGWLRWWVVTDDPHAAGAAAERGLTVYRDARRGLNDALGAAMKTVRAAGARSATVVPADVPLARPEDLADVADTGAISDVVVVPSGSDGGTNALYMRPPGVIEPRFGPSSLRAHVGAAERRSLRCSILSLPRVALDIDTAEDVRAFAAVSGDRDGHTARALARLGASARDP